MSAEMAGAIPVSVVVVGVGQSDHLHRCLMALDQQFHHPFEVVIVADAAARAALGPFAGRAKVVDVAETNLAVARNRGIAAAAGEVVAFTDAEAVAEPSWLTHLIAPFATTRVDAAGGWVLGRDGLAFRTRSRVVDRVGQHDAIAHQGPEPLLMPGRTGLAARTAAANMAWRRTALTLLRGFDEALHDDLCTVDLNLRLAARGGTTALVPLAQVHHAGTEWADRVPASLSELGASWALFLSKHARGDPAALAAARRAERRRLVRHALAGAIWPWTVRRRLAEFDAGAADATARPGALPGEPSAPPPFRPWHDAPPDPTSTVISGSWFARGRLRDRAVAAQAAGTRVTLICLSPTARRHSVHFDPAGIWVHSGGTFGRVQADGADAPPRTRANRLSAEVQRLAPLRNFTD